METGNSIGLITDFGGKTKKNDKKVKVDKVFKQKGAMPEYVRELYGFKKGDKNEKK